MRVYEVGERLYVSGFPGGLEQRLAELGVTEVFCVCTKETPPTITEGRVYTRAPLQDNHAEITPEQAARLRAIVSMVLRALHEDETVLVHCIEGRNRSMLVAALVERRRRGISGAEALAYVRAVRPRCVYNPAFASFLEALP